MLPDFSSLLDTETVYAGVGQGGEHEDKKGTVHKYPLRAPLVKVWVSRFWQQRSGPRAESKLCSDEWSHRLASGKVHVST